MLSLSLLLQHKHNEKLSLKKMETIIMEDQKQEILRIYFLVAAKPTLAWQTNKVTNKITHEDRSRASGRLSI